MKKKTMLIVQMLSSYSSAGLLLIISASPSLRASASLSFPNQTEVSGKVTSADDGSPLPGVNVVVKGGLPPSGRLPIAEDSSGCLSRMETIPWYFPISGMRKEWCL